MITPGYLGIDAGTQGLSIVFTDQDLKVLATGEGQYAMVPNLDAGCYEQFPSEWIVALTTAMNQLRSRVAEQNIVWKILAIGLSGQMHGEVLTDNQKKPLSAVRLWCDARNEAEGNELTERFGTKIPKRMTVARWLWTIRNRTQHAAATAHMTTPAGWLAFRLTGQWKLGIGDAAGMFPIDQETLDYDQRLLDSFDELVAGKGVVGLRQLLPSVTRAGEDAGCLNESGAKLIGLPIGIPVAPAEGDQPASLAGSLIGAAGMVSVSFGTSVCANAVGDRAFTGVSPAVDHFCAPDGKPINMVFLRNGTTFMNTMVEMFGAMTTGDRDAAFESVMPQVLRAAPDCGGLLAVPFMDDEPGLGITEGGRAMLFGLCSDNATPGNAVKAALLSTMFNLRLGIEVLDRQNFPRTELVLSGGLTNTPELAQVLANVCNTRVSMLSSANEGCAWGAALMAKFRCECEAGIKQTWESFLSDQRVEEKRFFEPDQAQVEDYEAVYQRYLKLLGIG